MNVPVTSKQILYEFELLKNKLMHRDICKYSQIQNIKDIDLNPVFYSVVGEIENWEKIIAEIGQIVQRM